MDSVLVCWGITSANRKRQANLADIEMNDQDLAEILTRPGYRLGRENRPAPPLEPTTRIRGGKRPEQPEKRQNSALSLPENIYFHVLGAPVAKPRQTQRDKWAKRPCVLRYREWADRARKAMKKAAGIDRLDAARKIIVNAYFPMPVSWSSKQRAEVRGTPHRQKPDGDNTLKSVCDSLIRNDETIYRKEIYKEWAIEGQERVEIFIVP